LHLVSHFCSGFCVGSILFRFGKGVPGVSTFTFPVLIGTGAMLPDLDGISIFFDHEVYYGSSWYSHHGALHSLIGIIPLSLILASIITIFWNRSKRCTPFRSLLLIFALLYSGNIIHVIGDLPCPLGPWWGLMMFWPVSTHRFGGWSHIWWLNEYLMMVLFIGALSSFVILGIMAKWPSTQSRRLETILILINLSVLFFLIRFIIVSRYIDPIQWQEYQTALLGEPLYTFLKSWNNTIQHIWIREIL